MSATFTRVTTPPGPCVGLCGFSELMTAIVLATSVIPAESGAGRDLVTSQAAISSATLLATVWTMRGSAVTNDANWLKCGPIAVLICGRRVERSSGPVP